MTNTQSNSSQVASKTAYKTANKTVRKPDPFAALKSSIMIVSIVGTMAGWLVLLNQEADSLPENTAELSTSVSNNTEMTAAPVPNVDISQLRQVNEIAPVEAIRVVTRTRSSQ